MLASSACNNHLQSVCCNKNSSAPSCLTLRYDLWWNVIWDRKKKHTMLPNFAVRCNYCNLYLAPRPPSPCKTGRSETDWLTDCCLIKSSAFWQLLQKQEVIPFLNHSVSRPRATWIIPTKLIFWSLNVRGVRKEGGGGYALTISSEALLRSNGSPS